MLTAGETSISVTWSSDDIKLVLSYKIRVGRLGSKDDEKLLVRQGNKNNDVIVNGLQQNTTYIVWVSTSNSVLYSEESEPGEVTTLGK